MRIFSNLAISLDGRIADPQNPSRLLGSKADHALMEKLRLKADVVLMGAGTLRVTKKCVRHKSKTKLQPANAIVSGRGDLSSDWSFWDDDDVIRFVFTTGKGEASAMRVAQDRAFVEVAGETLVDPLYVVQRLKASGYKNLLVEGGGHLMGTFLKAKLLQEIFVTLTPWVLGESGGPSLVESDCSLWQSLDLLRMKKLKSEIFLHYKVKGAQRV